MSGATSFARRTGTSSPTLTDAWSGGGPSGAQRPEKVRIVFPAWTRCQTGATRGTPRRKARTRPMPATDPHLEVAREDVILFWGGRIGARLRVADNKRLRRCPLGDDERFWNARFGQRGRKSARCGCDGRRRSRYRRWRGWRRQQFVRQRNWRWSGTVAGPADRGGGSSTRTKVNTSQRSPSSCHGGSPTF